MTKNTKIKRIFPNKISAGDEIRIIAPSRNINLFTEEQKTIAQGYFDQLGLKLSFAKNVAKENSFFSSSIQHRINDLHEAFSDTNVKGILTVIGGFNCNSLLPHIDFNLIAQNPKILCGYSDITALSNAILAKSNLVSYCGPHWSSFSMAKHFEYTLEYFKKCLMTNQDPYLDIAPSDHWSDDMWWLDQNNRNQIENIGFEIITPGSIVGIAIGGTIGTYMLLQGTDYKPHINQDMVLFLEGTENMDIYILDRQLQSLMQQNDSKHIKGIVMGRCQQKSNIDSGTLKEMVKERPNLHNIPFVYGLDFGHTSPHITFPIGGTVNISAKDTQNIKVQFTEF